MTFVKQTPGAAALAMAMLIGSGLSAPSAQATYIVTLVQQGSDVVATGSGTIDLSGLKRLTENELSDFSRWWHDGCGETIIEAQHVDRNHSPEV
jgi:hypothetical protein